MLQRIKVWLDALKTGLWPVPLAMLALSILLYLAAGMADRVGPDEAMARSWWLHSGTGADARSLLSTLVGAIITMSSIVFSITVVALTLAANQFGSRLVRTYMTDLRTKLALGLFTTTIVYCLLALRSVEEDMTSTAVPHVTVTVGLVLGLACVLALLFFLHTVARSIVADEVIRRAARELEHGIARLPPLPAAPRREPPPLEVLPAGFAEEAAILPSREEGYVQTIAFERLTTIAAAADAVIRLQVRPGAFMSMGGWLAEVYPRRAVTPDLAQAIQDHILIGEGRTPTQDLEFSIRHLVDIALRALSPGINDANTALVVIDHLRGALSRLMGRDLPSAIFRDEAGAVRVVGRYNSHASILDAALHQIRQAAAPHPAVVIALLAAIGRMAEHLRHAEHRDALSRHVRLTAAAGLRDLAEPSDRGDIERARAHAEDKLERALRERRRLADIP